MGGGRSCVTSGKWEREVKCTVCGIWVWGRVCEWFIAFYVTLNRPQLLQASADGTPAASTTGTIPVSKVLPYTDNVTDSSLSTSMIILIVFACIAGLVLIAVIVGLLVYCCYCRRKR